MAEHSIQVDLDDPRSKAIADVLGNKTCKKILELFESREEVSKSDVSSSLGMPLNTVGYNMKKLLDAGLIEKSSRFFWSIKGKRIATYRLSNKRIVISPKRLFGIPAMAIAGLAIIGIIAVLIAMQSQDEVVSSGDEAIKKFSSIDEIKAFLKERREQGAGVYYGASPSMPVEASAAAREEKSDASGAGDFSRTNVQVEGVDEPDIVKSDGKYIYAVSGNSVFIIDAYPAEKMKIAGRIKVNMSNIREIFVKEDRLVVLGDLYGNYPGCRSEVCISLSESEVSTNSVNGISMIRSGPNLQRSYVFVYDIKSRESPALIYNITQDGNYIEARMIGEHAYIITNTYIRDSIILPYYSINSAEHQIGANEIYYHDGYDNSFVFTGILSLSLESGKTEKKVYLMGTSGAIYVSKDNIYLTGMKSVSRDDYYNVIVRSALIPMLPEDKKAKLNGILEGIAKPAEKFRKAGEFIREYSGGLSDEGRDRFGKELQARLTEVTAEHAREYEKTVIHKINVDEGRIQYQSAGAVSGRLLNQFSMDEFNGNLRVATTTSVGKSGNHLYVLDNEMNIIGRLESLAEGERIYSARFMGDRAYMVTFRQIDPLFVIDLKEPGNPRVLGQLKIPGFSDYLHPYDGNYLIGTGKETRETGDGRVIVLGMKISLFDATDVANPREKWKIVLGERGTDSFALHDHKAFLFSRERNLMVLPVIIAEINKSNYANYGNKIPDWAYGEPVWQGAYVFNVDKNGIEVRGKVTHFENESISPGWKFYDSKYQVKRSLYMDNVLYTISKNMVKANNLDNMSEIGNAKIGSEKEDLYPMYD